MSRPIPMKIVVLCVALGVAACSEGDATHSAEQPPPPPPPPPSSQSLGEAVAAAGRAGSLPTLNRDATVAGPDIDNNGIRDDLDALIAALPDAAPQKAALRQSAVALQAALTADPATQGESLAASRQISAASACLYARFEAPLAHKKSLEIEKLTVNTRNRLIAYQRFAKAIAGTTIALPQGDGCVN